MSLRISARALGVALLSTACGAWAAQPAEDGAVLARVRGATVTVEPSRCAGVLVAGAAPGAAASLVTAAHCIADGERMVEVSLADGRRTGATVEAIDRSTDVAVLSLDASGQAAPLEVAPSLPMAGSELLFAGRNDRAPPLQSATVARLGRCPSLPAVPFALFTTLEAAPGDSGSPLVDDALRVVGLVHGGAACNIATPSVEILPVLATARAQALQCRPEDAERGVGGSGP